MKNIFIYFFSTLFIFLASAQDKNLKTGFINFSVSNYDLLSKNLSRFAVENEDLFYGIEQIKYSKKSEDLVNMVNYYFLKTNLFFRENKYKKLDSAFYTVNLFKNELQKLEIYNKVIYDNNCIIYKVCKDKMFVLESQVEDSLFSFYTRFKDVYTYESFMQKFPKSKNYGNVLILREDLIISNALETNDLQIIEESLKEVTNEDKIVEVRHLIENRLIDEAIKSLSESKLEFCLDKFPSTLRRKEIEGVLENIYIEDAKKTKNIDKLNTFSIKFPTSFRKLEVLTLIENYIVDDAIGTRNISKLDDCISKYPNSSKHTQMLILLESLEIEDAVLSKDQEKIIYCINKYPLNPSVIYLKDMMLVK